MGTKHFCDFCGQEMEDIAFSASLHDHENDTEVVGFELCGDCGKQYGKDMKEAQVAK